MSDDYQIPKFQKCPRCGERAFDVLKTSSQCVECGYSPTFEAEPNYAIPHWVFEALAKTKLLTGIGEERREDHEGTL